MIMMRIAVGSGIQPPDFCAKCFNGTVFGKKRGSKFSETFFWGANFSSLLLDVTSSLGQSLIIIIISLVLYELFYSY